MSNDSREPMTVNVRTSRLGELLPAMHKLSKKANAYGSGEIRVEIGQPFDSVEDALDWDGRPFKVRVNRTPVTIYGEAPRIGNHRFLAHLELTDTGAIIDKAPFVTTKIDKRFYTTDSNCDHCKVKRARKDLYVVEDIDTGRQRQVGRSCLRDFLGIDDPKQIVQYFAYQKQIKTLSADDEFEMERVRPVFHIPTLLAITVVCIRQWGWVSRAQEDFDRPATADDAIRALDPNNSSAEQALSREIRGMIGEPEHQLAGEVLAWVRDTLTPDNDYTHNLKMVFQEDVLYSHKRIPLAVSAVHAYQQHMEAQKRAEAAGASKHVGEIKERLKKLPVRVAFATSVGIDKFSGRPVMLYKLVDTQGNELVWTTSANTSLAVGDDCVIDGTVKEHNQYKGAKQTLLARVKVLEPASVS